MTIKTTLRITESNHTELKILQYKIKKEKNKFISLNQLVNIAIKQLIVKEDPEIISILKQYNQL